MIQTIRRYLGTQEHSQPEYLIEPSTAYDLLKNERRLEILRELTEANNRSVSVGELSTTIACRENGIAETEVTSDQRTRVYVALIQSHLPKLADDQIIEYDADRGTVSGTAKAEVLVSADRAFSSVLETN